MKSMEELKVLAEESILSQEETFIKSTIESAINEVNDCKKKLEYAENKLGDLMAQDQLVSLLLV